MCTVNISGIKKQIIFVVIKKLIKNCIFGVDALQKFQFRIFVCKRIVTIFEKEIYYGLQELSKRDIKLLHQVVAEIEVKNVTCKKRSSV